MTCRHSISNGASRRSFPSTSAYFAASESNISRISAASSAGEGTPCAAHHVRIACGMSVGAANSAASGSMTPGDRAAPSVMRTISS